MAVDMVGKNLTRPIQLADQVAKFSEEAEISKQECNELKSKTEALATLLRQAARASDLYEKPTIRILQEIDQVLDKALSFVSKCRDRGLITRVFTIVPAATFKKLCAQLDNSIADVTWLLAVSKQSNGNNDDEDDFGLPPIVSNDPMVGFIWNLIAKLQLGNLAEKTEGVTSLESCANGNDRQKDIIVEEGGVPPLLKLLKEGGIDGQENAAKTLGLLGTDPKRVEVMVHAGVCSVFAKVLKEGSTKLQGLVAWAVSVIVEHDLKSQDIFAQNNSVRLLVGHLAHETLEEHRKYMVFTKPTTMIGVVNDALNSPQENKDGLGGNVSLVQAAVLKGKVSEDKNNKAYLKAMSARALWHLTKDNPTICKIITESKALLCLAVLLEKGTGDVQINSAMALMEIARVAEKDSELRCSAFKPSSPAAKSVVEKLLNVVEKGEYNDLLIPCINALGCLARAFRASEKRIITPLVNLLDDREDEVMAAASIALSKYACTENYLHHDHSRAIIDARGVKLLVQLALFGCEEVKVPSLVLLCYITLYVPESEVLVQEGVRSVLEGAAKQGLMMYDNAIQFLLDKARSRLELYQSRSQRN
ncbi:Armadillo repeat only 2 protein [Zostera marina]|uniref:Armadillo repeat only 2 protein n=1 Tax=Zostera marina TaxID=29655 RepID=A0A0K9P528_ZOSMR|nr:Armadillo repeat only 2 protein [Zostera marina]